MADDGFHEIQLGKKQLVFFFMAGVALLVMFFIIGVWVGRGAKRPQDELVPDAVATEVTPEAASAPAVPAQPPTQVASNELDYTARLQTGNKAEEPPKATEPPTPAAESGDAAKAETKPDAKADAKAAKPDATKPPSKPDAKTETKSDAKPEKAPAKADKPGGITLQVGAFGTKKPADTLVAKLKKEGYDAYVFTSASGPTKFKVRVGPFADRASADAAAEKLKKEGLSPLVQR